MSLTLWSLSALSNRARVAIQARTAVGALERDRRVFAASYATVFELETFKLEMEMVMVMVMVIPGV